MVNSITAKEFSELVASGRHIDLIDVRTPAEFREVHVTLARNEPLDRLDPKAIQAGRNGSAHEPLYVICRSGARGKQACEKFISAGILHVVNVEGGTTACASEGIPVVRGKKAIPLNCQVQIITGVVVLVGSILAVSTNNPYWLTLPIMMGAGLTFSGLTNTCGMAAILARMPWNQVKASSTPSTQPIAPSTTSTCTKSSPSCCH